MYSLMPPEAQAMLDVHKTDSWNYHVSKAKNGHVDVCFLLQMPRTCEIKTSYRPSKLHSGTLKVLIIFVNPYRSRSYFHKADGLINMAPILAPNINNMPTLIS